jgi:hypothetical protein
MISQRELACRNKSADLTWARRAPRACVFLHACAARPAQSSSSAKSNCRHKRSKSTFIAREDVLRGTRAKWRRRSGGSRRTRSRQVLKVLRQRLQLGKRLLLVLLLLLLLLGVRVRRGRGGLALLLLQHVLQDHLLLQNVLLLLPELLVLLLLLLHQLLLLLVLEQGQQLLLRQIGGLLCRGWERCVGCSWGQRWP